MHATAVNAASASGLRLALSRLGGKGMTPRSTAQEAANERGSKKLLPRSSSAETPSASASVRSKARSAAISAATGSGTPRRLHSLRHCSTKSFMRPPRLDGSEPASTASRAVRHSDTPRRVRVAPRSRGGSTYAEARRYSRPDRSRPDHRARASQQRIDGALANDRKAAVAQPLGHLVAVRGPLVHHRQQAEVEHTAEQFRLALYAGCHAPQGSIRCLVSQALDANARDLRLAPVDPATSQAHRAEGPSAPRAFRKTPRRSV